VNIRLGPSVESLCIWALEHDDPGVADDAAVQLARRDKLSESFITFLARWVPAGRVNPTVFERFAQAWEIREHELAVAKMSEEIALPDDLLNEEGPGA